tara:strand:- start:1209 stop:1565 length:357 start_codon:yes stop_codon:yes gene_type:complete
MIKICKTNPSYFQDPLADVSTGIYMEFDNGNNISIQWGRGNYGSYRDSDPRPKTSTAEVLISHETIKRNHPIQPMGWCDSDMVAALIYQTSTMTFGELVEKYGTKDNKDISYSEEYLK